MNGNVPLSLGNRREVLGSLLLNGEQRDYLPAAEGRTFSKPPFDYGAQVVNVNDLAP